MTKLINLYAGLVPVYHADSSARRICKAAFALSVLFILITIAVDFAGYIRGAQLSIHRYVAIYMDRSIPEFFGYLLALGTGVLLLKCYERFQIRVCVFWACFFFFAAVDDAIGYHEQMGLLLVETLKLPALPGLRAMDSGELIAWAIAGVFLLVPLAWSMMKRAPGTWHVFSMFSVLFIVLIIFGVGVDMFHEVFPPGTPMRRIVNWTEDGGEMLVLAASLSVALLLSRSDAKILI
ncbi:MAG: hypothetical protein HKP40_01430 [Litoreibacter sp.]|nr:hypothetical protein [Litoreibacter sp.]